MGKHASTKLPAIEKTFAVVLAWKVLIDYLQCSLEIEGSFPWIQALLKRYLNQAMHIQTSRICCFRNKNPREKKHQAFMVSE